MKLFEISEEIENCLDPETGEFNEEKFNELSEERERKLEYLIQKCKNHMANAKALKEQEDIFKDRRKSEESKAESIKKFLTFYLKGEEFSTATVKVNFKASQSVEVNDGFVEWCESNERKDLLTYKPSVSKTAVKAALDSGEKIPAYISDNLNISVK